MTQENPPQHDALPKHDEHETTPDATPEHRDDSTGSARPFWARGLVLVAVLGALMMGFVLGSVFGGDAPAPNEAQHDHEAAAGDPADGAATWTCSMHPQIQSGEPGLCPICAMALVQVESSGDGALPPSQVRLTERARALARIQTTRVAPRETAEGRALRLLGQLDYDETRARTVTPWTGGRIERLHVATTGQEVRRGQIVATLYSPETYTAQQDLIQARKQLTRLNNATPLARTAAQATLEAARNRLRLLGVTRGALKRMEASDAPWPTVPIRTPFAGTVVERLVDEGQYVSAGTGLYKLVELSHLWAQLDAYEQDLPLLSEGGVVTLTFEALPGERFDGTIAFIDPVLDTRKRTARVRVEVANPDGRLRPGMFAEAVVRTTADGDAPSRLFVPDSAPLFSGRRSLVYVEVEGAREPTYEAREVRLGARVGDAYPVIAGLRYGERVVTHGAFRLDADLQLRGGDSLMTRPDDRVPGAFEAAVEVSAASRARLAPIVTAYLNAQESLTEDDLNQAKQAVEQLIATSEAMEALKPASAQRAWVELSRELLLHARVLARTGSLEEARRAFEAVTAQIEVMLETFGNPTEEPLRLAYCPMAFNNRGARWFQRDEVVKNAYFGPSMPNCGEVQDTIDAGSYLAGPADAPTSAPASSPAGEQTP